MARKSAKPKPSERQIADAIYAARQLERSRSSRFHATFAHEENLCRDLRNAVIPLRAQDMQTVADRLSISSAQKLNGVLPSQASRSRVAA